MQSLKSERAKKEYEQFVKEVTPKQNLFCNMAKAFIVGGLICVVGQILLHIGKTQFSLSKHPEHLVPVAGSSPGSA